MAKASAVVQIGGFGGTQRRDAWWVEILPVVALLGGFGLYATFRAFEGKFYEWGPYLSPFYSPLIDPHHTWWRFSPALLVLAGPLGFRATCYYYRKAYYRAFFLDPPACAVSEGSKRKYRGETAFPFILQNLHRWFLYLAIVYLVFLWRDAIRGFFFADGFGIGVGSLISAGKHHSAHPLHLFLPLAASPRGREARLLLMHRIWALASHGLAVAYRA